MGSDDNENAKKLQTAFVLKDAIKKEKEQMESDRESDEKNIPKGFLKFIDSDGYYNFLLALLEYCRVSHSL